MKHKIYILLLLAGYICTSANTVSAQREDKTIKYGIIVLGTNIGELSVNQHKTKDEIVVEALTKVDVKIVFHYKVQFYQKSIYRNKELYSSHIQTLKNGEVHSDTWLKKNGNNYLLIKKGDTTIIKDKIAYSGSMLYFDEPVNTSTMYLEINGEKNSIKEIANHIYLLTDNDNQEKSKYTYKNGILQRSEIKHAIADIYVERK